MLPHFSATGIDLAKSVLSFATALISFLSLFKKNLKGDIVSSKKMTY
jgi:hypothetical protein